MRKLLPETIFHQVVEHAPLVAIDLIVRDGDGSVLLGKRINRPAKGTWFTPGGRIHKGLTLDRAFAEIANAELGFAADRSAARLLGAFDHIYDDSVVGCSGVGTHYVVLAYELALSGAIDLTRLPLDQHTEWKLFARDSLLASPGVHDNVKAYF